jgi:hypothetical protein
MTVLTVAFHNFANKSKNGAWCSDLVLSAQTKTKESAVSINHEN